MSNEGKSVPAQSISGRENFRNPVHEVIGSAGRSMIGKAVPWKIQANDIAAGEEGSQPIEAASIVQPTMEGQNRKFSAVPTFGG